MKQVNKNTRKMIFRQILNFLFICFLIIVAVRAKGNRDCCPGTDVVDQTEILEINNDTIYYSLSDDTLYVNFKYRITSAGTDSFNYFRIYFYARSLTYPLIEVISFASDDTIALGDSVKDEIRRDTLMFTRLAHQDSYLVYVNIDAWENEPGFISRQNNGVPIADDVGDDPTKVFGPGGRQMILFMGNRRICDCDDTLNDPYAYPLLIQIVDEDSVGINNDTLRIGADYGNFEGGYNNFNALTGSYQYMQGEEILHGVAPELHYIFPSDPMDIVITVKAKKPGTDSTWWKILKIPLKCFEDNENSGLEPPKSHETTDSTTELSGDGYNDGVGSKTIKIEIDYHEAYSPGFIQQIIDTTKPILETAKLEPIFVIGDSVQMSDSLGQNEIRECLARSRNNPDHIHILIGTHAKGDSTYSILGENVDYNSPYWGDYTHTLCAHLASTDSVISQPYLDSTGIIIYGESIFNVWANLDTLLHETFDIYKMFAVCLAHEIGHASGLYNHHTSGVMIDSIDFSEDGPGYSAYNSFDTLSLNLSPPSDAMNCRDVLGIHTIDTMW